MNLTKMTESLAGVHTHTHTHTCSFKSINTNAIFIWKNKIKEKIIYIVEDILTHY